MSSISTLRFLASLACFLTATTVYADHIHQWGHQHGTVVQTSTMSFAQPIIQPAPTSFITSSAVSLVPVQNVHFLPNSFFVPNSFATPNSTFTTNSAFLSSAQVDDSKWELKPVTTTSTAYHWIRSGTAATTATPTGDIVVPKSGDGGKTEVKTTPAPGDKTKIDDLSKRLCKVEKDLAKLLPKPVDPKEEKMDKLLKGIEENNKKLDALIKLLTPPPPPKKG